MTRKILVVLTAALGLGAMALVGCAPKEEPIKTQQAPATAPNGQTPDKVPLASNELPPPPGMTKK